MSENNNTNHEEETKTTVKIEVNASDAGHVLALFDSPFPSPDDLDEIVLVIKREKSA